MNGVAANPGRLADIPKLIWVLLVVVVPAAFGAGALMLGKDVSWDFRNYHFYNAYALLNQRLSFDLAPAQLQTFHNPIIDLPLFAIVQTLPSHWVGFVAGAVHGVNFTLVFCLSWAVCRLKDGYFKVAVSALTALVACLAPAALLELGSSYGDNIVSLFVLGAVIILVLGMDDHSKGLERKSLAKFAVAGLIMGAGAGLKLTASVFALGSAVALFAVVGFRHRSWALIACYGIGGLTGALLTHGPWAWTLWQEFGNPVFPYMNHIFRSPAIAAAPFVDTTFLPTAAWQYFFWPLLFSTGQVSVEHLQFVDIRFAVLYAAIVGYGAFHAINKTLGRDSTGQKDTGVFDRREGSFLLVFVACSFIVWMVLYSVYRYLLPLEMLVPLCLVIIIDRVNVPRPVAVASCALLALAILAFLHVDPPDRHAWRTPYTSVDVAEHDVSENDVVVMLGWEPMAFVIPAFPAAVRFVRPGGNLRLAAGHGLFGEIETVIRHTEGVVLLMHGAKDDPVHLAGAANALGLRYNPEQCRPLATDPPAGLSLCRAEH